ncbi:spectrin beta non-erythrocytic 1 isoform X3, partial [Brachionus plicatilis]
MIVSFVLFFEYQPFYTSIHGNLMCFFIDKNDYNELNAATQPINLFNCKLNRIEDTTIQRDVIHLETEDGAEYLFDAAGDELDMEKFDLWMEKIVESSASPSQSGLSTYNLTSTSHLNISTGDLNSLSAQTPNKPRSRAPVVMSLPPIKSESIDNDVTNEDYYSQISSPLNKSTEAQRMPIYENVPLNNSFNN